jgi:hypothetical protein
MTSIISNPSPQGKEKSLIIANDNFKMRVVMTYPTTDLLIKQTCLGPTYGTPVKRLRVVPGSDSNKKLLAFSTYNKVNI